MRVASYNSARASLVVLACTAAVADVPSESVLVLDRFDDGGFWLFSDGRYVTEETLAGVPGGARTLTFLNVNHAGILAYDEGTWTPESITSNLDGTLALDEHSGTLAYETDGDGVFEVGYGFTSIDGWIEPDLEAPLNLDLSSYELLRIKIIENEKPDRAMLVFMQVITHGEVMRWSNNVLFPPNGFEGDFDIDFASLKGNADFADIDSISVAVLNAYTGFGFTLGGFEFVDTDPPPFCFGDCDNSGIVDFDDIFALLGRFGRDTDNSCDTDFSGSVDFNDIVNALGHLGRCP